MLHLFGMSYLSEITEGYQSVHPLKAGWQERITLWQLYPIACHCVFFGGGYVNEYRSMCRSLLKYQTCLPSEGEPRTHPLSAQCVLQLAEEPPFTGMALFQRF